MNSPPREVAAVFSRYEADFVDKYEAELSVVQRRAMQAITRCDDCGHEQIAYNSCRNRHCPQCPAQARARWLEAHAADLLPIPYFRFVFTLPEQLRPLTLQTGMDSCSARPGRRCATWRRTRSTSAPGSARVSCSTQGNRT